MKTLSIGRFPPLCFALETATRELSVAQELLQVPTLRQTSLIYMGWSFPQAAQEKVQNVQREAYIPSKVLPLRRNLVPRKEFRSPRSLGPSSTHVSRAMGCICCSLFFPIYGAHKCRTTQQ